MTKYEVGRSILSVCSAGEEEEKVKGSCDDVSQCSACPGSPGSLPLLQSHGFGAARSLLEMAWAWDLMSADKGGSWGVGSWCKP